MSIFDDVHKFMLIAHPDKLAAGPCIPPEEIDDLCQGLILEEKKELTKAWANEDLVGIADGIADLIWVLVCMAQCYGIPIDKVWDEVAKTNMAKFPDGMVFKRDENGKVLKPPGWQPPNIKRIIDEAIAKASSGEKS